MTARTEINKLFIRFCREARKITKEQASDESLIKLLWSVKLDEDFSGVIDTVAFFWLWLQPGGK